MIKKAQIGSTITWTVAFVLIFFIMMMFIAASSGLTLIRRVAFSNVVEVHEQNFQSLKIKTDIISMLNSGNPQLKYYLINSEKELFENELELPELEGNFKEFYSKSGEFFDSFYDNCYVTCVFFNDKLQIFPGTKCGKLTEGFRQDYRENCGTANLPIAGKEKWGEIKMDKIKLRLLRGL